MKKLLFLLLFWGMAQAQNTGGLTHFPGGCAIVSSGIMDIYRMPDTSTIYRTLTADQYGFYEPNLALPGQYRFKLRVFGSNVWIERKSHIPVIGIGGDSTSNAGRLIQNALDSLPPTGGIIYLPPGKHLLDSLTTTLNKSNTRIVGTGANCIVKSDNSFNAYQFTVSAGTHDVSIENLVMEGNRDNQTSGGGINANGAGIRNIIAKNVIFRFFYDNAFVIANGASGCGATECTFDTIGTAGASSDAARHGVYITGGSAGSYDNFVDRCTFNWWSGTAAVRINNNCHRTRITGSTFKGNDRTGTADRRGIFADSGADGACTYTTIADNDFFDLDENAVFSNFNRRTDINHNDIDSVGTASAITGNGIECNDDFSSVTDNNVSRAKKHGISINNTIGTEAGGNHVSLSYGRGIYFFAASGDSLIGSTATGNIIWNNNADGVGTEAGLEIQGEDGVTDGLLRHTTFMGNTVFDDRGTKLQNYGISAAAATGFCQSLLIVGNNVGRNLTGAINDGSDDADDVIANNQTTP